MASSLFVPFFVFILNGTYTHSFTVDKPTDKEVCVHAVAEAIAAAKNVPEGGQIVGGCLPLPSGVIVAPAAPPKAKDPLGKDPLDPESPRTGTI